MKHTRELHRQRRRTAMSRFAKQEHKRAARMLGYCLTLEPNLETWANLSLVLRSRLTHVERVALAWAALRALDEEEAEHVLNALQRRRAA